MNDRLDNLGLIVEVPIRFEDARTRQLPEDVGKLILYATENSGESNFSNPSRLAKQLWRWVEPDEHLYAAPFVPYLSERKMKHFLASNDLEAESEKTDPQTYLIRCANEQAITKILSGCASEAIIFLMDKDGCTSRKTLASVDEYRGDYRGYEVPFMRRLPAHGGFFFYASSHESIEVLGTIDFVLTRCLIPLATAIVSTDTGTAMA